MSKYLLYPVLSKHCPLAKKLTTAQEHFHVPLIPGSSTKTLCTLPQTQRKRKAFTVVT